VRGGARRSRGAVPPSPEPRRSSAAHAPRSRPAFDHRSRLLEHRSPRTFPRRWSMKAACSGTAGSPGTARSGPNPSSPNSSLAERTRRRRHDGLRRRNFRVHRSGRSRATRRSPRSFQRDGHAASCGTRGLRPAGRILLEPGLPSLRPERSRIHVLARVQTRVVGRSMTERRTPPRGRIRSREAIACAERPVEDRHFAIHRKQPAVLLRLRGVGDRVVRAERPGTRPSPRGRRRSATDRSDVQPHWLHADRGRKPAMAAV